MVQRSISVVMTAICMFVPRAVAQPATPIPTTIPVSFEGVVIDQDDKPVAHAKISLIPATLPSSSVTALVTTTDNRGTFKLDGDSSMRTLHAWAPGDGIASAMVNQQMAGKLVIALAPATQVHVHALGPDGKPAAGVKMNLGGGGTVWVPNSSANGVQQQFIPAELAPHYIQTTDANGDCTFKDWPQDSIAPLRVEDDRYISSVVGEMVTLRRAPITEYTIHLQPGAWVSGRVTLGSTGKPAGEVFIQLISADPNDRFGFLSMLSATTDANGEYMIRGIRAGEYDLYATASQENAKQYPGAWVSGISIVAGSKLEHRDMQLTAGATVRGTITGPSGEPVPNARISIRAGQGRFSSPFTATTGEDGTYEVHSMPGNLNVQASGAVPGAGVSVGMSKTVVAQDGQAVTADFRFAMPNVPGAGAGGVVQRNPTSAPAARNALKGIVVDPDKNPVPYANILVHSRNDPNGLRRADANRADAQGRFQLPRLQLGSSIQAISGTMSSPRPIPIPGGDDEVTLVVRKEGLASAMVKVTDDAGMPIKEALLALNISTETDGSSASTSLDNRATDADGTWLYTRLSTGLFYRLEITAPGYGSAFVPLTLQGGNQTELVIMLKRANSFLNGLVVDENGNPIANATLRVQSGRGSTPMVKTNGAGIFRVENLVPDEMVSVSLTEDGRAVGSERGVAGRGEIMIIQRQAPLTGGRRGVP